MSKLIIDYRENKIINIIKKYNKVNYEIKNLDIGDFVFEKDNNQVLIIERKTIDDLYSSIIDGRYKEQKLRLINNYPISKIIYIIENTIGNKTSSHQKIIYGSIINTLLRDNIKILRSENINETINYLYVLYKKINHIQQYQINALSNDSHTNNSDKNINNIDTNSNYLNTIKIKKKDNMTPESCQIIQLSQIPGVSINISKCIMNEYKTIRNLIKNLEENENILENLQLTSNTGKTRKLGPKLSKRIFEFFII